MGFSKKRSFKTCQILKKLSIQKTRLESIKLLQNFDLVCHFLILSKSMILVGNCSNVSDFQWKTDKLVEIWNTFFYHVSVFEITNVEHVRFRIQIFQKCQTEKQVCFHKIYVLHLFTSYKRHILRYRPVFKDMIFKYIFYGASDFEWESFNVVSFRKTLFSKNHVSSRFISVTTTFLRYCCFFGKHDLYSSPYNVQIQITSFTKRLILNLVF